MRPDGVWEVTAKGPRYDGRDLFQSFFDVAGIHDRDSKVRPGLDLRAEIDTVVGYNDVAAQRQGVAAKAEQQADGLDARGVLEGSKPSPPCCVPSPGKRGCCGPRPTMPGSYSSWSGFIITRSGAA